MKKDAWSKKDVILWEPRIICVSENLQCWRVIITIKQQKHSKRKPPRTPKFQLKTIWGSNPDFWINLDPDVCRICPKIFWMHYLVNVIHFAKCGTKWLLVVWEANKCPKNPLFCSGEENEKVIWYSHTDPDHHQKLTTSRGSPLAHVCQVWSTTVSAFLSYPVYIITDRTIT